MEENKIPERVLYINLGRTGLRGRQRNRPQDGMREDGRVAGGDKWQEKVHNREEWKKLRTYQWNEWIITEQNLYINDIAMTFSYLVDVKHWINKTRKHSSPRAIHNYKICRWWIRYGPNSYLLVQVCDWLTACHGVVDCTLAIWCEKRKVPSYASQKMSLQAAKFLTRPNHLPRCLLPSWISFSVCEWQCTILIRASVTIWPLSGICGNYGRCETCTPLAVPLCWNFSVYVIMTPFCRYWITVCLMLRVGNRCVMWWHSSTHGQWNTKRPLHTATPTTVIPSDFQAYESVIVFK